MSANFIIEPARQVPVDAKVDLCVVGGGCTGVFAAVRAARLGAKVAIVEATNAFGGVATNGLVNIWHTLMDMDDQNQIIAGLTDELLDRLRRRHAVEDRPNSRYSRYILDSQELKIELDLLIKEIKILPYLHTRYCALLAEDDTISAILIENKDGRRAIEADFFIDATGDGDLARDLKIPSFVHANPQPATSCFIMEGLTDPKKLGEIYRAHHQEFGLADDWGWDQPLAFSDRVSLRADTHVFEPACHTARALTRAEMVGRNQARAFAELLRAYGDPKNSYRILATCAYIGIRETVHYETCFKACEMPLLLGERYDDAILNGTYRIDIHHGDTGGITFKELNGQMQTYFGHETRSVFGNWRKELGLDDHYALYYQLPFATIVPKKQTNFIAVGRMLNADPGAFGALRVMVNLNQLGEAAGVAAYLCMQKGLPIQKLNGAEVRAVLRAGGSA